MSKYTEVKAQLAQYPSAAESDPIKLGIMQGFPTPDDKIISAVDATMVEFPALRYAMNRMREFMPTKNVAAPTERLHQFEERKDEAPIDALTFTPMYSDTTMTFRESLDANYTDGMLILHRGVIVYEKYFGAATPIDPHHLMSVTKTFTGTLGALLVAQGVLDEQQLVQHYVPELEGSAFGDATVRQVMDMLVGLDFNEDYADPNSDIAKYSLAGQPFIPTKKGEEIRHYYKFLTTVEKAREHGQGFAYKTVNTDVLAWVLTRATGKDLNVLLSELIWKPIGAHHAAYFVVDKAGTPFAGGGLSATLRDLGRFGEMVRCDGQFNGNQVLPKAVVDDIRWGGDREKFVAGGYTNLQGWSYRSMWWVSHNEDGAFTARGINGQTIYIDPKAEMVLVRTASHPVSSNEVNDLFSLPAYQAVADYLKSL